MIFLGCLKISWTDPPVCICAAWPPWGQRFTPRQLSKDNRPIVLLLFLTFLHAKDIWRNMHVFQRGGRAIGKGTDYGYKERYGLSQFRYKERTDLKLLV